MGRQTKNSAVIEKNFYKKIIGENFNFISKDDYPDSYITIENFKYVFTTWSTLGVEKLVKKGRVGFIFNKPDNSCWNGARLGSIEKLPKRGPFWTTCKANDQKEFNRIFRFVLNQNEKEWTKVRKKFGNRLMEYDEGNKRFLEIIKKCKAD